MAFSKFLAFLIMPTPSTKIGAPLLGYKKPVIKAHGSSNAKAIKNAIRQAIDYINTGIIDEITASLASESTEDEE